ncbi:hypothetical protein SAMN04487895_115106 [Paenibacillus sophorae]|uniref:Major Facilitator Superfamily protein n=1 Tax=Paenibacillus sophorae TaxID=1333845 RepID=A0A1H8TYI2_9BACL|nr:hypothetical protein [Paenibacillus sophorae]QWU13105.1 hypothetical protein KP014_13765 [Paenibacillus sophorae]SEO96049.1 hypothetical protein SAMN04487895_115106 [Paenibacillus sophorae]
MLSPDFFKVPRQAWALVASSMLVMAGFSFLWPLTVIYLTQFLHQSVGMAGMVLSAEAASGILGSMFGGVLFFKFGGKRTLFAALVLLIPNSVLLLMFRSWLGFIVSFIIIALFIGTFFYFRCRHSWAGLAGRRAQALHDQ